MIAVRYVGGGGRESLSARSETAILTLGVVVSSRRVLPNRIRA
jgi:hypothetical protein